MLFDAIVLAGGRARRMGGVAKPLLKIDGTTLLDRAIGAAAGAGTLVVVGPAELPVPQHARLISEDPPFGGPAAAAAAGLNLLRRTDPAPWVLILAADQPGAGAATMALLAAAETPDTAGTTAALIGIDGAGRRQFLTALYRFDPLAAAVQAVQRSRPSLTGLPMHRLVGALSVVEIPLPDSTTGDIGHGEKNSVDIDTWADAARWGAEFG